MFHINSDVIKPWKLSRKWFNLVASFLNNICGDGVIEIVRPDEPSAGQPVAFHLNIPHLRAKMNIPAPKYNPLELNTIVNQPQGGSVTVTELRVFLPTLVVKVEGSNYTVQSGTASGTVAAVTDMEGWYKVNGITTGTLYLRCSSGRATFSTSGSSAADTVVYKVGTVGTDGMVAQYDKAMGGELILKDEAESGGDIPADNITGTVTATRFVIGSGAHTVKAGPLGPAGNGTTYTEGIVMSDAAMSGNTNCLPYITRLASIANTAKIESTGIEVVDAVSGTRKCIKGDNVKITAPSGTTIHDFDNVCVDANGCLKLDQTDYAYFNTDESQGGEPIVDEGIIVADGTTGKVKAQASIDANKIDVFSTEQGGSGMTLDEMFDAATEKVKNDVLSFMTDDGEGNFSIDFDQIGAVSGGENCIIGTDSDGYLDALAEIPQEPATDKVLMVKAGATVPTFEDATGGAEAAPMTLQVKAVTTTNQGVTTLSYLKVYLPQTSLPIWDGTHNFRVGTANGYIQAITGEAGWYRIYGITTGNLYLVDDSYLSGTTYTRMVKFATAALSDTQKYSGLVANITFSSNTATVKQGGSPFLMTACPSNGATQERPKKANTNLKVWHSSTGSDTASSMTSTYKRDTQTWERGVTQTLAVDGETSGVINTHTTSTEYCGVRLMMITRIERQSDEDVFYWRYAYFDKNGCLYKLDAESDNCFVEKNSQFAY